MFIDEKLYVDLLCQLKISANQFLLCHLLHLDERDIRNGFDRTAASLIYKHGEHNQRWSKAEITDLIEKQYLIDKSRKNKIEDPALLEVTDKFKSMVYEREDRFQEIWELYPFSIPNFTHPSLPRIKLKICDKDAMSELYNKAVTTKASHLVVLETLRWAVENNQINFNLENFVKSRAWEGLIVDRKRYTGGNMTLGN